MIKLDVKGSLAEIHLLKSQLTQAGIDCLIKNDHLAGAIGELPIFDCGPELWLIHDKQIYIAESHIASLKSESLLSEWACSKCSEANDGAFEICWNCQSMRQENK
jgi:hypothetical protein